jgi:hypothetical protein
MNARDLKFMVYALCLALVQSVPLAIADVVGGSAMMKKDAIEVRLKLSNENKGLYWSKNYFVGKLVVKHRSGDEYRYYSKTYITGAIVTSAPLDVVRGKAMLESKVPLTELIPVAGATRREKESKFDDVINAEGAKLFAVLRFLGKGLETRDVRIELERRRK